MQENSYLPGTWLPPVIEFRRRERDKEIQPGFRVVNNWSQENKQKHRLRGRDKSVPNTLHDKLSLSPREDVRNLTFLPGVREGHLFPRRKKKTVKVINPPYYWDTENPAKNFIQIDNYKKKTVHYNSSNIKDTGNKSHSLQYPGFVVDHRFDARLSQLSQISQVSQVSKPTLMEPPTFHPSPIPFEYHTTDTHNNIHNQSTMKSLEPPQIHKRTYFKDLQRLANGISRTVP